MASHVSHCMAKSYACRTHGKPMCVAHGKPCVIMHGPFENYKYGSSHSVLGAARFRSWEQQGEGGGREKRKGGKEKRNRGKGKKKKEGKRRRKRRKGGKRKRKRKECRAVSRTRRKRTRNCATRGRFPPTLVILRLGAV